MEVVAEVKDVNSDRSDKISNIIVIKKSKGSRFIRNSSLTTHIIIS